MSRPILKLKGPRASSVEELLTDVRVSLINHEVIKAIASMKVANVVYLRGIRVMEGKHGLFLSMPARKTNSGEYRDIFFPASKEVRDVISKLVLDKYQDLISQG